LEYEIYEDGSKAYLKEQEILETFKDKRYLGDDYLDFGGFTELFYEDIKK